MIQSGLPDFFLGLIGCTFDAAADFAASVAMVLLLA
jgi:hypothetical protein